MAQEDARIPESFCERLQRGRTVLLSECLNRTALDNYVKRTGTHSSFKQASDNKVHPSAGASGSGITEPTHIIGTASTYVNSVQRSGDRRVVFAGIEP